MEYLEERGQTAIALAIDGKTEAVFGLIDQARDEATLTVNVLEKVLSIQCYMLTGDHARTARVVAGEIGIAPDRVIAGVLPEGKVDCIQRLQREGHRVAMIADGVNDAGALAQAEVGVAIGAGTDVAIETAGVVLVNSKLTDVIVAIHLAHSIYARIRWNFVWALGYNTLAIPIAAGALYPVVEMALPPFMAAIAMVLSSLSVLFSSLLLNRYRPPQFEKKYGRLLRKGELGLEHVSVKMPAVGSYSIPVTCHCTEEGGVCNCPPGQCQCGGDCGCCTGCKDDPTSEETLPDGSYYPGCQEKWGQACSCSAPCRCVGCSSCGSTKETPKTDDNLNELS